VLNLNPITRIEAAVSKVGESTSDFDLNPDVVLPEGRILKPAAVLVAFQRYDDQLRLILTKRASHLKHHPGQIAFPGGKLDEGDDSLEAAALREAWEEIGLPRENVRLLGRLPSHETVTSYQVTPIVAEITQPFEQVPEAGEVAEVFTVPASHILNPANFVVERRRWRGVWRSFYTVPYGPYYIWGATARMLRSLADTAER
jgi:8-oxo-dGTP pyrophosphatase MutT (NUDIX family)